MRRCGAIPRAASRTAKAACVPSSVLRARQATGGQGTRARAKGNAARVADPHPLPPPLQQPPSVRAYLEKEVVPTLMPALVDLARERPAAPLAWLADRLRVAAATAGAGAAPPAEGG